MGRRVTRDELALAAAYRRLTALQDEVDHQEYRHAARSELLRADELVRSQLALDAARERRADAVREARVRGMSWARIARTLHLSEAETKTHFGYLDRITRERAPSRPPTD
jgi:DNA-directed RNA polymerase specialized sigma24 family protein